MKKYHLMFHFPNAFNSQGRYKSRTEPRLLCGWQGATHLCNNQVFSRVNVNRKVELGKKPA